MTQEQEKVFKCLKRENQKAIKNGAPYVKDETLLEQFCERIPDKNAKHFLSTTYKIIIDTPELSPILAEKDKDGVKPLERQGYIRNLKLMEVHGIMELLCWELFLSAYTEATPEARKINGELFNKILANMEFNSLPLFYMPQDELTQKTLKNMSKNTNYQLMMDGTGEYEEGRINTSKYFKMVIAQFSDIAAINDNTIKLFVLIHEKYGRSRTPEIVINIDEWLSKQGMEITKSSRDNARKVIKNQLELLYSFSLSGRVKRKKEYFDDIRIIDSKSYPADGSGNFYVTLGRKYEEHIRNNAPIFAYDLLYTLKRDTQIKILLKLGFNYRSNEGKERVEKISVKSLLEFCGYPKLDHVRAQDGSPKARIMKPFIKDLIALQETDNNFYFSFITNVDDTEIMLEDAEKLDFDDFYNNYYLYCDAYAHLPQNTKRIEAKRDYSKQDKKRVKKASSRDAKK